MGVSSKEQNKARWLIALTEAGVAANDIYLDKHSGRKTNKKGLC